MPLETLPPPTIDEERGDSIPETQPVEPETVAEQEPLRESIETVGELLEHWKAEYDQTEDTDRKQELAYRIVKLGEAVSLSGLHASEVKIRESEPGVLGFYVPSTGEIAITPAGLSLPPEHFADVLVHESIHASGISDEGLTQIKTEQKVAGAMSGIYPHEKAEARKAFEKIDISRALDAYDFDNPKELFELYLEVEWRDEWKNKLAKEFAQDERVESEDGRKELLEGQLKDWVTLLDENLEKAVPRLFAKAEANGFELQGAHQRFFSKIVEDWQRENATEVN